MRLFTVCMLLGLGALAPSAEAVTLTKRGSSPSTAIIELAPLRGLIGQPAARGEAMITPSAAIAGGYESWSTASEREDFTDRHTAMHMEAAYYPLGFSQYPVFVGGGLRYEQAEIGRQETRRTTTWARTSQSERYDRWVNHDSYVSLVESVGYRLVTDTVFTGSIRLVRDELLNTRTSNDADQVISNDPDLGTKGRPKVRQQIIFFAGLMLR